MTSVARVTVAGGAAGAGVATPRPALGWAVETDRRDWMQESAEIQFTIASVSQVVHIQGAESTAVAWPFTALNPGDRGELRVRVTGINDVQTAWSAPRSVEATFLGSDQWVAPLISHPSPRTAAAPILLRRRFLIAGTVARARIYATAQGVYELELNGTPTDDHVLKPGWVAYQHRLVHESTDIESLLQQGENVIGVRLAGGWFTEQYGFRDNVRRFYGDDPAIAIQLAIEYDDGRVETIVTDDTWVVSDEGPLTASSIYHGEHYDARRALPGWATPQFDDTGWLAAQVGEVRVPRPSTAPPVRRIEEVAAQSVTRLGDGRIILDFGQNLVGRLRLRVTGERGDVVHLRHAEVLEHGELALRPLRGAAATDSFTLAGGTETWEPRFTFHGFRYAEIADWPGVFDAADVTAIVIHSDMRRTGGFSTSHPLLDRLHQNVVWGMRGNFLSIPTDCPQRDERLGWTGDIQVFAPTATFLYDCSSFLRSWLDDLRLEQGERDGMVPMIVPDPLGDISVKTPAAAWGDAATVVPTVLYERFGDPADLLDRFSSMRDWVDAVSRQVGSDHLWSGRFQFGDWLDPAAPPDYPGDATTDPDVVATAQYFRSSDLVARAAGLIGLENEARHYSELREDIREAYLAAYVTPAGRVLSDSPTAYAMTIAYGIEPSAEKTQRMGARLAELVRSRGYLISTGFVGTPIILSALAQTGHVEAASRLLLQTENPSWLYSVSMGATTIWERWDSLLEDGSVNPGEMTSFNHYAFGAVADWLHCSVAGLAPASPGFREFAIAPLIIPGLDDAHAWLDTPFGRAESGWRRGDGDDVDIEVIIPPNTTARVRLPGSTTEKRVGSGRYLWRVTDKVLIHVAEPALATPLSELVDDQETYAAVLDAFPPFSRSRAEFRRRTKWLPTLTLRDTELLEDPNAIKRVSIALDELRARRAARGTQ